MKAEIKEKTPGSKTGFDATLRWLKSVGTSTDNLKGVWNAIEPEIKQGLKDEFSDKNPNLWQPLSKSYKKWKTSQGFPETIGVRTGTLRKAMTDNAIVKKNKKKLKWMMNAGLTNKLGEQVGSYASAFNSIREIFGHTRRVVRRILKKATAKQVKDNTEKRNV